MPRITFVQAGARHNYALPRFLYESGMLQRFYTDFGFGTGDPLRHLVDAPLPAPIRAKLARRHVAGLPAEMVRAGNGVDLGRFGLRDLRGYAREDLVDADGFYLQHFTGGEKLARIAPDKKIISDVFIVPYAHRTINAEIAAFPDWGEAPISSELATFYEAHSRRMFEQSHVLFCPSQAVIEDVARYDETYRAKCRLVQYGASLSAPEGSVPEPGRVLFCGSLQLRKGVQYIALAAARLAATHPHIHFVMAGGVTPTVRAKLVAPNITVLGHLGKDALMREFARADLFLFPSLAEGSAGTVLEALASGLPIVATRESGVDFTDGESGLVISPRDPDAIAQAVVRIVDDRTLRDSMSRSAAREAKFYAVEAWKARFVEAIRDAL